MNNKLCDNSFIEDFCQETKVRLLADKIRMHGITARLADDYFCEYIGLDQKKSYICDRILNAEHVLANLKNRENLNFNKDEIKYFQSYILNARCYDQAINGLVSRFYFESFHKSANDELSEALREFEVAVKGGSDNQKIAKTEMAKIFFNLKDKPDSILNLLADYFVASGICGDLINRLTVCTSHGKAKWDKYGPLIVNRGAITPYCSVKLISQDYQLKTQDALIEINEFAKNGMHQFLSENKKKKFISGEVVVKTNCDIVQQIS